MYLALRYATFAAQNQKQNQNVSKQNNNKYTRLQCCCNAAEPPPLPLPAVAEAVAAAATTAMAIMYVCMHASMVACQSLRLSASPYAHSVSLSLDNASRLCDKLSER